MLTDQLISYLAGARGMRLNYRAGETAVLVNQEGADPDRYQLFTPTEETQDLTARGGRVVVKSTDEPGAYRLKGFRGEPVIRGFSVNIDPAATDLTRVAPQRLDDSLGAGRFQLAKTRDEIDRNIGEARVGRQPKIDDPFRDSASRL